MRGLIAFGFCAGVALAALCTPATRGEAAATGQVAAAGGTGPGLDERGRRAPAAAMAEDLQAGAPASRGLAAPVVVDSVAITVADLDASVAWYRDVLSFTKVEESEVHGDEVERLQGVFGARVRRARLRLGEEFLELWDYLAPEGRPVPADSRSNDRWFQHVAIVVRDMQQAYARLRAHDVRHASAGPQRLPAWNPAAGGIEAFYFKDPDGHVLEVIWFPPGKGDPRWQHPTDQLFLGIDHTAIVVEDSERSLSFWRDTLGLRLAGGSENWGIEQERLNNVFGARLRITTLRGERGPGVELLEYLAPRTGRSYPPDSSSNDLWHWQTQCVVQDVAGIEAALRRAKAPFVSPGVMAGVPVDVAATGKPQQALLARDPDGHAVLARR
jgi:catechol 2,3-dioxygenase-like lactoylglutathione lyase family enzyme